MNPERKPFQEPLAVDAPRLQDRSRTVRFWRWTSMILAGVILALAIAEFLDAIAGDRMGPLSEGLPVLILLMVAMLGIFLRVRTGYGSAEIVFYVAEAVRLNLPLATFLDAAAASEKGRLARRLCALRDRLIHGESLATALQAADPNTPARTIARIDAAERSGQLEGTLRGLAARAHGDRRSFDPAADIYRRWYPIFLIIVLVAITAMLMVFVVPKLQWIYKDFGVRLPATTRALISIYRDWGSTISAACAAILILLVAKVLLDGVLRSALRRPFQWLLWWTPVMGVTTRSRALADAIEVMAETVASGGSISSAVLHAARLPTNPVLQRRLIAWSNGLAAGLPISQAAAEARMPRAVCGMMALATNGANLQATLRFLARDYENDVNRSRILFNAAIIPMISLVFGAVVLFVVLALFQPLIDLVNHLSKGIS